MEKRKADVQTAIDEMQAERDQALWFLSSPVKLLQILGGYTLGFGMLALVQAVVILSVSFTLIGFLKGRNRTRHPLGSLACHSERDTRPARFRVGQFPIPGYPAH